MPLVVGLFALLINSVNPQVINSTDDTVIISASASGLQSGVTQYLQVAMTKDGETTNYLGLTQNLNGEWFQYKSSPSASDLSTYFYNFVPISGSWSGQLVAKVDTTDDGYKGPGNYLVKLIKYISSSGSYSNNSIPITINIPLVATDSGQTQVSEASPALEISAPDKCFLGDYFKVTSNFKNFAKETEYYLKLRGGPDDDHLTKLQTKNGDSYLSDNESWESFPNIKTDSNGNWSGEIIGLLDEDKTEGVYKIKIRARKKEADTFSESNIKEITFTKPVVVAVPVATKSSVVATEAAKIASSEPEILAESIELATPESLPKPPVVKSDSSPLAILGGGLILSAVFMAAIMHKNRLWAIIRSRL